MNLTRKLFLIIFISLLSTAIKAQPVVGNLEQFISSAKFAASGLQYPKEVKEFYVQNAFKFTWLDNQHTALIILQNYIAKAKQLGLQQEDYHPQLFRLVAAGKNAWDNEQDSLLAEVKFTDAAIHFFHDVNVGNKNEQLSYNGLQYSPSCYNIPSQLHHYLNNGRFSNMLVESESKLAGYISVKNKLNLFLTNTAADHFKDAVVSSKAVNSMNKPLLTRLFQLGLIASDTANLSESALKAAVKEAQRLFALLSDGVLRSTILQAMNVPMSERIAALQSTLNTLRWLSCMRESEHMIVVNIPSAEMALYDHEKIVLDSRVIVGKPSTPTPTLCSRVTEVILYPYWNVPYKIATQELLPRIRRNPGYLEANNYQVLNSNGKVVDPLHVNWRAFGPGNFPYVIRQSTGCDNALGLIKLNFYNPFSVYLHDTPGKSLFSLNKRYFSHGCMRLEKAMEAGRYILKENAIAIDTLTEKGCLKNQAPIIVPATETIPVFVLYHTAWPDSSGRVMLYEDIYDKFPAIKK